MSNRFVSRVLAKALILFVVLTLLPTFTNPLPILGRISAYNVLFPGRLRLPYGDNPQRTYNLSLFNVEAMFASHELSAGQKPPNEYRVLLIGDSATWGFLLKQDETLSAQINAAGYSLPGHRRLRAYNLGYPVMSLAKDLLILSYAVRYQPDMIVWLVTLESFPYDKQLFPPLVQHNPGPMQRLIRSHNLNLNPSDPGFTQATFFDRTLIGQRRALADLVRLQLYGVLWAATGIDQDIPENQGQHMEDLPDDLSFHNLKAPLKREDLAFDILRAGISETGGTPVIIINEPTFISHGTHSDVRYNYYYPRWAYDEYRRLMAEESKRMGWNYDDFWDAIPAEEFTNTAIHMTPKGTAIFANLIAKEIIHLSNAR